MYSIEIADREIKRLLITSDIILSLIMFGNLLYTRAVSNQVSNQVSKLQGQVDSLYKTMNSEKNKKDDKLLDKK